MHDTELCAFPGGCDNPAGTRDLCPTHRNEFYDPPPLFRRYLRGRHGIGEVRPDGLRWCSCCRDFVKLTTRSEGARRATGKSWSPECVNRSASVNRETRTGWSSVQYDEQLITQGNRCAICGRPPMVHGALHADHNHATGARRKLLCHFCNTSLGKFEDNPEWLRRAALYVEGNL